MPTIQIRRLDVSRPNQLYVQYQGQNKPQPCYVSLDLDSGELAADYRSGIGGETSLREWNGVIRTWSIPPVRSDMANELLAEIAPIAQRVLDGASVEWEGGRFRGRLSDAAAEAAGEIEDLCQELYDRPVEVIGAAEYFEGLGDKRAQAEYLGITASTTDEQLAKIAADHERMPEGDADVVLGVLDHLTEIREDRERALRIYRDRILGS